MVTDGAAGRRFRFSREMRLRRRCDFEAVFAQGRRLSSGALTIRARPNGLGRCRLGLAISRRCGNAVKRNALKRRIREAFRLAQHDLPGGYDLVVTAVQHEPLKPVEYQQLLLEAARSLHEGFERRGGAS